MSASLALSDAGGLGFPAGAELSFPRDLSWAAVRPRSQKVEVAAEILDALETYTMAGQRHAMQRIVTLLNDEIRRLRPVVGRFQPTPLDGLVERLGREAARLAPEPNEFKRWAQTIVGELIADA